MALLVLLFVSPFCALSSALFAARVTHHVLLTALVAPLLVAAWPARIRGGVALWAGLHAMVFWGWHAPPVYGWALSSDAAYWLMQLSLLGSAFALWNAIRAAPLPGALAALLGTMVQMGLLGALITFAPAPLYAPHMLGTMAWGLTPIEDQQLAGLIMWAPGAAVYLGAAVLLLSRWFAREQAAT
jgi:putative membrane protein